MKKFTITFYRPAHGGEIGPQVEQEQRAASSKTEAIKTARLIAKQAGWRFIEARQENT